MIKLFKTYNPNNYLLLLFYALLLKWPVFLQSENVVQMNDGGFLSRFLIQLFFWKGASGILFSKLFLILLFYFQSVMINKMAQDQRMFAKPNYLPGMSYLLCSSLFMTWNQINESLLSLTIIIWLAGSLSKIYNIGDPKKSLFNIGLALGIATLIYFPALFYLMMLMIGLAILRPFKLAEWIIMFLGLITPYYFIACYDYLTDTAILQFSVFFNTKLPVIHAGLMDYIIISLFLIAFGVGFIHLNNQMSKLLVNARKSWSLFFIFILISLVLPFVDKHSGWTGFNQLSVPLGLILSAYFFYTKSEKSASLYHWLLIIAVWSSLYFFPILERML